MKKMGDVLELAIEMKTPRTVTRKTLFTQKSFIESSSCQKPCLSCLGFSVSNTSKTIFSMIINGEMYESIHYSCTSGTSKSLSEGSFLSIKL